MALSFDIASDIVYLVGDRTKVDRLDTQFYAMRDATYAAKADSTEEVRVVYKCVPIAIFGKDRP